MCVQSLTQQPQGPPLHLCVCAVINIAATGATITPVCVQSLTQQTQGPPLHLCAVISTAGTGRHNYTCAQSLPQLYKSNNRPVSSQPGPPRCWPSGQVSGLESGRPGAGIMEADDRQVTTVLTVQPSFHHRHSTNRVA